jgi:hypothetical protein
VNEKDVPVNHRAAAVGQERKRQSGGFAVMYVLENIGRKHCGCIPSVGGTDTTSLCGFRSASMSEWIDATGWHF